MLKFCLLHLSLYSIQNGCLWKAWGWDPILAFSTWQSDVLDSTICRYLPSLCTRPLMSCIWFLFRCGSVSGLSLWIYWSVCLSLHQDHCFRCSQVVGDVSSSFSPLFSASLTSSFRNVFAILGLLLLYIYFRISLSNSSKMIGIFIGITIYLFPCGSTGKEYTCNVGDLGSIPRLGRSPGEGKGYSLQYSVLENSMDCMHSPWGHKELDTTERLSLHFIEHADN